jgi:predicted MFS family arabinose efflux permease
MSPRAAITAIFTLNGIAVGTWGARIPAIQDKLDVGPGRLAIALLGLSVGALLAMPIAGRLASAFGSRRVVTAAVVAVGLALVLPPLAPTLLVTTLAVFVFGASNGTLDVSMNAQGVAIERGLGRPVLSSFHAGFSFGGLIGAALGGLAAAAGLGAEENFLIIGAIVVAGGLLCARALVDDRPAREEHTGEAGGTRRDLWRLRLIAFCCLFGEGAALDWSAVHLRSIGAAASVAALAYAGFSLSMATARLMGDGLTERWGPVRLARRGGLLGAVALAAAIAAGVPAVALVAYLALGAGLAVIVPLVFRAAASGADAGPALASVTSVGYLGFLAGPPIIGAAAAATSVPASLLLVVAATTAVGLGARALAAGGTAALPRTGSATCADPRAA